MHMTTAPVRENLLVVDDEEMNRDMLSRRLERSGFRVSVARDGSEALRMVDEQPFDLILLDQMMPGRSGSEVLHELRVRHSASELPVIMVTALSESSRVAEALDAGANDYVTKPVEFTVALARIRSQLSRKRAEAERRHSEERYALAARAANDGLWDWDLETDRIYYSERWKEMMGFAHNAIGTEPAEWLSRVHFEDLPGLQRALSEHLAGHTAAFEYEYRIRAADEHYRWMVGRGLIARNAAGKPVRMAGSQSDVTQKKTIDPLTGLPNRVLFRERAEATLRRYREDPTRNFAAFFIDLDRFKLVNDSLGHLAGDQLLVQFSERLQATADLCREAPLVVRLAGDEFGVLIEDLGHPNDAACIANRILKAMRAPFVLDGQEFFSSASIGVALARPDHQSVEDILRDADTAMYVAKAHGRARVVVFDVHMRNQAASRLRIETDLRVALAKGQFSVHYQPRVDLATNRICGFEALLRWKHPTLGMIGPSEFIPVAEDSGMIRPIGLWVLGEACRQIKKWRDEWPDCPPLDVAVNVSPVQLRDPELVSQVHAILAETQLDPSALQIEVTESSIFENIDEARRVLMSLKSLGVGLKLDDFATGYSSLRHLYSLPFDSIKIDRSFTVDLGTPGSELRELVRTIMSMAQNLSLGVIAEGIENKVGANALRELGCRYAQGYYFSQAVEPTAIEGLLRDGHNAGRPALT